MPIYEHGISPHYLGVLKSLSTMFCNFQRGVLFAFRYVIPKGFLFVFSAVLNRTFFSFPTLCPCLYKNMINFGILTLYPVTLLSSLIRSSGCFVGFLGFFM